MGKPKSYNLGTPRKVEPRDWALLSDDSHSRESPEASPVPAPRGPTSAPVLTPTQWDPQHPLPSAYTPRSRGQAPKPVWLMSQGTENKLYNPTPGGKPADAPAPGQERRHIWSEDEYNSESFASEASDRVPVMPDTVMQPTTQLKPAEHPRGWYAPPGWAPPVQSTPANKAGSDISRAESDSSAASGHPESAAPANVSPMSPQISTDGTYRFFEQGDTQSKAGSRTDALKEGSFASGDNPFGSVVVHPEPRTLAELISADRVAFSEIEKEWKPHMRMQSVLYGAVPSYVRYLAMSESSHTAFQLIPPNLLSVSKLLGGMGAPKDLICVAMMSSSQAAGCKHSQALCSVFAQRRGASDEVSSGGFNDDGELAVKTMCAALATVPHTYTPALGGDVQTHVPKAYDMEKIVMACGMMGFISKVADGLGVELTKSIVDDAGKVLDATVWEAGQHAWASPNGELLPDDDSPAPPVDGMSQIYSVTRFSPQINYKQKALLKDVPKDAVEARCLIAGLGFDEPLLEDLTSKNIRHTLAGVLYYTLSAEGSHIGIGDKALAGIVFSKRLGTKPYQTKCHILAMHHCVHKDLIAAAEAFDPAKEPTADDSAEKKMDYKQIAALTLAHALGPSPAQVTEEVIEKCKILNSEEVVEIVTFMAVLQMFHRITVWRTGK